MQWDFTIISCHLRETPLLPSPLPYFWYAGLLNLRDSLTMCHQRFLWITSVESCKGHTFYVWVGSDGGTLWIHVAVQKHQDGLEALEWYVTGLSTGLDHHCGSWTCSRGRPYVDSSVVLVTMFCLLLVKVITNDKKTKHLCIRYRHLILFEIRLLLKFFKHKVRQNGYNYSNS